MMKFYLFLKNIYWHESNNLKYPRPSLAGGFRPYTAPGHDMRTGHTRRDNRRPGLPDINIFNFSRRPELRKRQLSFRGIVFFLSGIGIKFSTSSLKIFTCTCRKIFPKAIFARKQGFLHEKGAAMAVPPFSLSQRYNIFRLKARSVKSPQGNC